MRVKRVAPGWPVLNPIRRRRIAEDGITYVGLDVHKEGIAVAIAKDGSRNAVREYGPIANAPAALDRPVRKLGQEGTKLQLC